MGKKNEFNEKLGEETHEERDKRLELQRGLMSGEEEEEETNANANIDAEDEMDPLDRVVARAKKKQEKGKTSKELVGIYFHPEVKEQLNSYVEQLEKGAKSEFVSAAVESALKRKGIWKER